MIVLKFNMMSVGPPLPPYPAPENEDDAPEIYFPDDEQPLSNRYFDD